jgi:hypothetical protein
MPNSRRTRPFWQRLFNIKSDRQITKEVLHETRVKRAREAIHLGERVLAELEALEQRGRLDGSA